MTDFSDSQLTDYLNGVAADDLVRAIEDRLAQDVAFEDRLMALDPLSAVVRDSAALLGMPDPSVTRALMAEPVKRPLWQLAAAACFGAIVAGGALWATRAPEADWRAEVAVYQALYGRDTIAPLRADPDVLARQIARASDRVGYAPLADLVDRVEGLDLLRVQLLEHDKTPLAQLVFANDAGDPIALCLIARGDTVAMASADLSMREGLASGAFDSADHSWLLIGSQDRALIERTTKALEAAVAAL